MGRGLSLLFVACLAVTLPSAGLAADGVGTLTVNPTATGLRVEGQGWAPNSEWTLAAVRHHASSEVGVPDRVFGFRPDASGTLDVDLRDLRAASNYTVRIFPATESLPYVSPVTPILDANGLVDVFAAAESEVETTQALFERSFKPFWMLHDRAHDYLTRLHATETGAVAAVWLSTDSIRDECQLRAMSSLDGGRTFLGPADFTTLSSASCAVRWASAPLRGGLVGIVMTLGDTTSFTLFDPATGSAISRRELATPFMLGYSSAAVGLVDGSMFVATDGGSLDGAAVGGVSTWIVQSEGAVSRVGSISGASGWSFAMRADEAGNIGLAWVTTDSTLLHQRARLWQTLSTDQGKTFAAAREIDLGVRKQLMIEGAAFSGGIFHLTVADYVSGDAYYVQTLSGTLPQARQLCGVGSAIMMPQCSRGQYVKVVAWGAHVWLIFEGFSRQYDSQDERHVQYYAMESLTGGTAFLLPYETRIRVSTAYDATATIDGRAVLLAYLFFDDPSDPEMGMVPLFDPLALPATAHGIAESVPGPPGGKIVDLAVDALCDGEGLVVRVRNQGTTSLLSTGLELIQNGQKVNAWAPKTSTHLAPGAAATWNVGGPTPAGDFFVRPVAGGLVAGDERRLVCKTIDSSTPQTSPGSPASAPSDEPTPSVPEDSNTAPTSPATSEAQPPAASLRSNQDAVRVPGLGVLGVILAAVGAVIGTSARSRKQ